MGNRRPILRLRVLASDRPPQLKDDVRGDRWSIGAESLANEGLRVSAQLWNLRLTDGPRPREVLAEVRGDCRRSRLVATALSMECDPTRSATDALEHLLRLEPRIGSSSAQKIELMLGEEPRTQAYRELQRQAWACANQEEALAVLDIVLSSPPSSEAELIDFVSTARDILLVASQGTLKSEQAVQVVQYLADRTQAEGPAEMIDTLAQAPTELAASLSALLNLTHTLRTPHSDHDRTRALRRAAHASRRAGLRRCSAMASLLADASAYSPMSARGNRGRALASKTAAEFTLWRSYWQLLVHELGARAHAGRMTHLHARQCAQLLASTRADKYSPRLLERAVAALRTGAFKEMRPSSSAGTSNFSRLWDNQLGSRIHTDCAHDRRLRELLWHLSLGVLGMQAEEGSSFAFVPGTPTFRLALVRNPERAREATPSDPPGSRLDAGDSICLRLLAGEDVPIRELGFLRRQLGRLEPWAYTVVTATLLADAYLARGMVPHAVRTLAQGRDAYRHLLRLARKHGPEELPGALRAYASRCRQVLDAFEPPITHGPDPVRKIHEVRRRLPTKRPRPAPVETIDALDAVIAAGRSASADDLEERVIEQIARMLGGRVLLHRVADSVRREEPQRVHTLSSWTLHRLERTQTLRAHRIRRRPEFWRPEQRRPRGVIAFPIGDGVAVIAGPRVFRARDVAAVRTILRFLEERHPRATKSHATPTAPPRIAAPRRAAGLVGHGQAWRRVLDDIWRLGPTPCSVVIRGETGTGKELVARALHRNSPRARGPFVAVNCGGLNADTLLAELFGHVRGAFSGADRARNGLILEAHRGTLFLDEVGDMPTAMQVAFLRVLQERRVRPVGSARTHPVDLRLVAATHVDLRSAVEDGAFREDLYHRLHVMEVALPPLRERREDLPCLCTHLLARHGHADRELTATAAATLARYSWPGNVRELENVLQAAALLSDTTRIDADVIAQVLRTRRRSLPPAPGPEQLQPRAARLLELLGHEWGAAADLARALHVSTRTVNRDLRALVERGLVQADGSARARRYRATSPARRR